MKRQIHLICNAHLDPVWLWEWQEGAAEAVSTFRTAAELCEKNDAFVFNHNEVILYEWVREYEPDLFKRIQKLVKAGRWHIMGGWYLQPDCNMPSGESFVRQILAGREYFKKHFGVRPKTAINFDPFGHSRGLVQIMAKSGYSAYLFGRPQHRWLKLLDTPFTWVGFDGSQVTARRFTGWYNSSLGKAATQIEERIDQSIQPVEAILWGVGNHGGGPSRKDLAEVNALIKNRRDVEILHSTPDAYFDAVAKTLVQLPARRADINSWAIGCYTSMARVKQMHRRLENELFMTEKMAACAAANRLMPYPHDDLQAAGRDLMFAQFHDILPGSSIQPVEEAALRLMDHGLEILSRIKAKSFFALAPGQKKAKDEQIPILVFNAQPYAVEETVECEFNLPDFNVDGSFMDVKAVKDGRILPTQVEKEYSNIASDWRKHVVFRAALKPGMNRFDCVLKKLPQKAPIRRTAKNGMIVFRNESMTVRINARTGLVDRYVVEGKNYLGSGAFCPVVLQDNEDPWETQRLRFGKVIGKFKLLSSAAGSKFSGIQKAKIDSVRVIEDGDVRTVVEAVFGFEESFICQQYKLPKRGSEIEVETRVFWNQKNRMLKLHIPLAFSADRYLGQTAYGVQELPLNGNEAVAQKWVMAANNSERRALTCINDGIYGSDCAGDAIRLSLLRSPAYSGHPVADQTEIVSQDRFTPRIDQGERIFKFWIDTGSVNERLKSISTEAQAKNERPYALSFFPNGQGRAPKPIVILNNSAIELSAFKKAQSNADWIVRLFNSTARRQSVRVELPVWRIRKDAVLGPYEIRTLRVNAKGKIREVDLMEEGR